MSLFTFCDIHGQNTYIFSRIWSALRKASVQRRVYLFLKGISLVSPGLREQPGLQGDKNPVVHMCFRPPVTVQQLPRGNKPSLEAITNQYKSSQKFCAQSPTPFWVKRTRFFWTTIKNSEERPVWWAGLHSWELRPYSCGLLATDELVYEAHQKFWDAPVLTGKAELNDFNTKCL